MPWIGLRIRFMAIAVILTLGASAIWGTWAWRREHRNIIDGLSREGEMLVSTMAIPVINALLYEELGIIHEGGLLDNFIAEIMTTPRLIPRYAMVLDETGRVLAHNHFPEYGKIYTDELTRKALQSYQFIQTDISVAGERVADLAMPLTIAGKRWGCLRVGISMEPAYHEITRLEQQIVMFSIFFSGGALVIYWIIGTLLVRPIKQLTRSMEGVGENLPALPTNSIRQDEIGRLQQSFVDMLKRLNRSETERNISTQRLLENERILAIGHLVSGVAHEVNNPLAGIEGALYQIERKGGERVTRYVDLVRQSLARIGRIVGQLSDLSRVGDISRKPIDSTRFFDDMTMFARMAVKDASGHLITVNRCPPATLLLDRDKIHQVILNLVINAADATGAGGHIHLTAECRNNSYLLHVENTGEPIPEAVALEMFTPFFTTKEAGQGSGMGLAVSRGIAENHGGSLIYRRRDGHTVFTLRLPGAFTEGTES